MSKFLSALVWVALVTVVQAQTGANEAYRAHQMIQRAQAYLEAGNTDPGVKLLQDVPRLFPTSEVRFKARLALGEYFFKQRQFPDALDELMWLKRAEDEVVQAEGMYRTGICYYEMNDYDKAFIALRKVTNDFPWSVWANEAFYYVGLCHFKMKRWARAYDALQMVGVSVPTNVEQTIGEAGRRIWVKVSDRDLVTVLHQEGASVQVQVEAESGDREQLALHALGSAGTAYLGSLEVVPGAPISGDHVLQFLGREAIKVVYVDETTADGESSQKLLTTLRLASTASIGFTDGAFRDYVQSARLNHELFVRLKDFDGNQTEQRDTLTVTVRSEFEVEPEDDDLIGLDLTSVSALYEPRDSVTITLTETDSHSGTFTAQLRPVPARQGDGQVKVDDGVLHAQIGDRIVAVYEDELRPMAEAPVPILAAVMVLDESQQDVEITQWVVKDVELKAEKHLIESQIHLRLGQIFKEVGLQQKADEKAVEGLDRIAEVIRLAINGNLPQATLEDAFHTKWDLLLVQDDLRGAVDTCNTLLRMYPESRIADRALLQIGKAKLASEYEADWPEASAVFSAVLRLTQSELKAEAQFCLAQSFEKIAYAKQKNVETRVLPQNSVLAYKACANTYPESAFAGQSLEKVVQFYIETEDYQRAVDLMELVFQDFVDASFLDVMLLKWAVAVHKMGNPELARVKLNQLIAEYPNSKVIRTAMRFRDAL